ncbi:glycosyltransferase N-terminal domain-containing protein [Tateyamaria sp.]
MGCVPERFSERLGLASQANTDAVIWIHVASLGEVTKIGPLARLHPGRPDRAGDHQPSGRGLGRVRVTGRPAPICTACYRKVGSAVFVRAGPVGGDLCRGRFWPPGERPLCGSNVPRWRY